MLASSASEAPVGGPEGGARPFCASVSSPRNQSSGGWVQNSLVPDSYFFSGLSCALAWLVPRPATPAMARMAAHASMDRLKADFIASLPMRPGRAAPVIYLNAPRDELWSAVWVRPQNATTSGRREKRAKCGSAGQNGMEK